ncbi:hypothetical protein MNBD_GAMMA01-2116 [hydrothermal vent metagenome]|uniref:Uncharacterized protein n=1 Tax=hydrothermal vent metagenome TaxID=652676 RepID=A0A3B0UPK8_9ZZZZ
MSLIKKYSFIFVLIFVALFFYFPTSNILKFIGVILLIIFVINFFKMLSNLNNKDKSND